jgi:succinate dehydrogenase / fumarate reductase flavoprotein subunit
VYLDFNDAIARLGKETVKDRYGNLFDMYHEITGEDPYQTPMRIYPAPHYTMGGLWVDYNLMSNVPGLFVLGEANFSDHGANRLGASALMQGLADGYFIVPYTMGNYLATCKPGATSTDHPDFQRAGAEVAERLKKLQSTGGKKTATQFHRELGKLMWDRCGMTRSAGSLKAALEAIPEIRERFWREVGVPGDPRGLSPALEEAGRVADFLEFAELLCRDALDRNESCGGHFREEYQYTDPENRGEAKPDHEHYAYVAAWEYSGEGKPPLLHKEPLRFEAVKPTLRSYK